MNLISKFFGYKSSGSQNSDKRDNASIYHLEQKITAFRVMSIFLYCSISIGFVFFALVDFAMLCHIYRNGLSSVPSHFSVPILTANFVYIFIVPTIIMRSIIANHKIEKSENTDLSIENEIAEIKSSQIKPDID